MNKYPSTQTLNEDFNEYLNTINEDTLVDVTIKETIDYFKAYPGWVELPIHNIKGEQYIAKDVIKILVEGQSIFGGDSNVSKLNVPNLVQWVNFDFHLSSKK